MGILGLGKHMSGLAVLDVFKSKKKKDSVVITDVVMEKDVPFREEMSNQMSSQAQENKKNLMGVGIGAVVLIAFIFIMFMKK